MLYCGMDLHAKESFVHVIDGKGERILARQLPTDPEAMYFKRLNCEPHRRGCDL